MAFRNRNQTVRYQHPEWAEDSFMVFRRFKTGDDDDAISALVSKTEIKFDPAEQRKARKAGKKYLPQIDTETKMSAAKALILTMLDSWEGEEFVVPGDWTIKDHKGVEMPHPLRGKTAPIELEWVGALDSDILGDIEEYLDELYAGKTEEEQKTFRAEDNRVA